MTMRQPNPHLHVSLEALRCFEVAARHLSFTAAAEELHVSPTAVSHQIKRLEDRLGLQLFDRRNRTVALTPAGAQLASQLHEPFQKVDTAVRSLFDKQQQRLRISAMPSLAAKWLAPRLIHFEQQHPAWQLRVDASDVLTVPGVDNVDVALRYGAGNYGAVCAKKLMQADIVAVCSPAYWQAFMDAPQDRRRHVLLHDGTPERLSGIPDWRAWLQAAGLDTGLALHGPYFESAHMAIEAAVAGHGMALTSLPLAATDLAAGRLIRPYPIALQNAFSYWMVCSANHEDAPGVKELCAWLEEEARKTIEKPHLPGHSPG